MKRNHTKVAKNQQEAIKSLKEIQRSHQEAKNKLQELSKKPT